MTIELFHNWFFQMKKTKKNIFEFLNFWLEKGLKKRAEKESALEKGSGKVMKIAEKTLSAELEDELESITSEDTALNERISMVKSKIEKDIDG